MVCGIDAGYFSPLPWPEIIPEILKKFWTLHTTSVAVQGAKETHWCLPLDIPVFPVYYLSYLVPKSPPCLGLQQILMLILAEKQEKQNLLLGGILGIKGSGWDVSEIAADLGPF